MDAFDAFDFDGVEQWRQHLANVELPGLEGSEQHMNALRLLRAKWFKKNVDSSFTVELVRHRRTSGPDKLASASPKNCPNQQQESAASRQRQEAPTRPANRPNNNLQSRNSQVSDATGMRY
jgi:hypothetical protein